MTDREERRERLVGQLLPYYLDRYRSSGRPGDESEERARSDAFAEAERIMRDSDDREYQVSRDRLGYQRSER